VNGSNAVLAKLQDGGAIVDKTFAEDKNLDVGSRITVMSSAGREFPATVVGIYKSPVFWQMLGQVTIGQRAFDRTFQDPMDLYTFIDVSGGSSAAATGRLDQTLEHFPALKVRTQAQFVQDQKDSINGLLNLLYVLLALSVLVSLFGIVNTLVLSVFERTREIGMLRAVGMTRRQVRRMIRHESVITALIGATLGMALGIFLAALVTRALSDQGVVFSAPVGSLLVFLAAAIIAGMLAAILPARRAARLNVLNALQYE
jgi:ABC-type antimicrobial peptide transport system permease subunit